MHSIHIIHVGYPLLQVGKHVENVNLPVPRACPGLGDQESMPQRPPHLVLHLARLSMVRELLFRLSSFEMTLHADYPTPKFLEALTSCHLSS